MEISDFSIAASNPFHQTQFYTSETLHCCLLNNKYNYVTNRKYRIYIFVFIHFHYFIWRIIIYPLSLWYNVTWQHRKILFTLIIVGMKSCFRLNVNNLIQVRYTNDEVMPMYPRIRDLREDHDLTQTKLALLYNTSIDYILGLTNEKKPYRSNN